ncbi:MAG: hypothetical protein M3R02_22340 [Chloroflexota bacterium]|nr:hypothetical protein [Chloroflexota bacterium]
MPPIRSLASNVVLCSRLVAGFSRITGYPCIVVPPVNLAVPSGPSTIVEAMPGAHGWSRTPSLFPHLVLLHSDGRAGELLPATFAGATWE